MSALLSLVSTVLTFAAVLAGSLGLLGLLLYSTAEAVGWCIRRARLWVELVEFFRWRRRPERQLEQEIARRNAEAQVAAELKAARDAKSRTLCARIDVEWVLGRLGEDEDPRVDVTLIRERLKSALETLGGAL